jgi:subtilisin family serine protease
MQRFSTLPAVRGAAALVVVLAIIAGSIGNLAVPARLPRAFAQDGSSGPDTTLPEGPIPTGDVIVLLDESVETATEVVAEAAEDGVEPTAVFSSVVDGYAATVTDDEAAELATNTDVLAVYPDNPVYQAAQIVPPGIKRIGADTNDVAQINGIDQRVDADVALLDSGVDPNTGDLNVAGGFDCADAGTYSDQSGHGTHVAGTIAANANNGIGVTGVAFNSPLSICKALNSGGSGTLVMIANCITWANQHGAKIISMSLGGTGAATLQTAVRNATQNGSLLIAAAGNSGNSSVSFPAGYPEVVSVAATDHTDTRASFSQFNSDVEIAAPGVNITSTWNDGAYNTISGTSMATPHVAGVAALIAGSNPGGGPAAWRAKLDAAVDDKGVPGRDPQYGFGRVNLAKAVP